MTDLKPVEDLYKKTEGLLEVDCAGGVVVRVEDNKIFVAFSREGQYKEVVLPKGHVDSGESVEQAAFREIEEELGFNDLELIEKLGVNSRSNGEQTEWKNIHYFLFVSKQKDAVPSDPRHKDLPPVWTSIDDLPEMYWPDQKALIEDNREKIKKLVLGEIPFKLQKIKTFEGINFYNDAKSQTPETTIQSINALRNIILIVGGDESGEYQKLAELIDKKVKGVYFLEGSASDKLRQNIKHQNILRSTYTDLETLLKDLRFEAKNRDNILFSPAGKTDSGKIRMTDDIGEKFNILIEKIFRN